MRDSLRPDGRLGVGTVALALFVGGLAAAAAYAFRVPGVDPSMWDGFAVVAGIRPPDAVLPGLWRMLASSAVRLWGVGGAVRALEVLGAAAVGVSSALVFLIVRQSLAFLCRFERRHAPWCRFLAPFFSFLAAVAFAAGDPLGRIGGALPPAGVRLVLFLASVHLALRWFAAGGAARILAAAAFAGMLSAETPFGLLLPIAFVFVSMAYWRCAADGIIEPPPAMFGTELPDGELPESSPLPRWRVLFAFLAAFLATAAADVAAYALAKGTVFDSWHFADLYVAWGVSWRAALLGAASPLGWVLGVSLCALPLLGALLTLPSVLRDDAQPPFGPGVLLFSVGVVALLQGGAFLSTRFWKFAPETMSVADDFLLAVFVLMAVAAVSLAGAALAFMCRGRAVARVTVPALFAAFAALSLRSLPKPTEAAMRAVVDDAVAETVAECRGAKWIFTDGLLDDAIELEALRRGIGLHPLDMMSGSAAVREDVARLLGGGSDLRLLSLGVPMLLRTWASEKAHGLDEAAVQLGFDFWRRDGLPLPESSGLVARTVWPDARLAADGVARAVEIARRIVALEDDVRRAHPPHALAEAYSAVAWRLSRFARLRGDEDLADALDRGNGALRYLTDTLAQERAKTFAQFTPKEGLLLALRRADFATATVYANAVLGNDEDDVDANFAMGMGALVRGRTDVAEQYLRKCLALRPDEPAVLNNLSILCRKSGRYDEAVKLAERALKLAPDNREVQKTLADAKARKP